MAPEVRVSLSSEVVPEIREYERTSTTVANVYVQGLVERYLSELVRRLRELGIGGELFLMLSAGGISTVETASRFPLRLLESGPAAGALASAYYGQQAGVRDLLAFDMGGTTAKLCVVEDGQPLTSNEFEVDRKYRFLRGSGLPVKLPVIDLIEIGAGGGSIAHVDSLGLLKVGPESAGAEPGPVCYGRGGQEPTVTDADLLLGYLDPAFFLGGRLALDLAAAEQAITPSHRPAAGHVGRAGRLGYPPARQREHGQRRPRARHRTRQGRAQAAACSHSAAPARATRIGVARVLHTPRLSMPFGAGVTSTVGFLTAPLAFDFVRTYLAVAGSTRLGARQPPLRRHAASRATPSSVALACPPTSDSFTRQADLRYTGQGHEVRVPVPAGRLDAGSIDSISEKFRPGVPSAVWTRRTRCPARSRELAPDCLGAAPEREPAGQPVLARSGRH